MTGQEMEEIAVLFKVPKVQYDLALRLNEELKLGYKSVGEIAKGAVREYAVAWLRKRMSTWFSQKDYQVLQGVAEKGGLKTAEEFLLAIYSLPSAELERLRLSLEKK